MLRKRATGLLLHLLQLPVEHESATVRSDGKFLLPVEADGERRYSGRDVLCGTTEML